MKADNRKARRAKQQQLRKQAAAKALAAPPPPPPISAPPSQASSGPGPAVSAHASTGRALISAFKAWFRSLSRLAKFLWGAGAFSVCLTALGIASDLTQLSLLPLEPEVQPQAVQVDFPFDANFTIVNRSALFDLRWVDISCVHEDTQGPLIFKGISTSRTRDEQLRIGTGDLYLYKCPMSAVGDVRKGIVSSSDIAIVVKYRTLVFHRTLAKRFIWDEHTRQWIKAS